MGAVLSIEKNHDGKFPERRVFNGQEYHRAGLAMTSEAEAKNEQDVALGARLFNAAAAAYGLPAAAAEVVVVKAEGADEWQAYRRYPESGKARHPDSDQWSAQDAKLKVFGDYLAHLIGDNKSFPGSYEVNDGPHGSRLSASPRTALKFDEETDEQLLKSFDSRNIALIKSEILDDRLPWTEFERHARELGYPAEVVQKMRARHERFRKLLIERREAFYESGAELAARAKVKRDESSAQFDRAQVARLHQQIEARFLKEFLANTTFKSFDEFKAEIMKDPVYAGIVRELQSQAQVRILSHSSNRIPILQGGFKSFGETGHSYVANDAPTAQWRNNLVSLATGMSESDHAAVHPRYHPKSTYVVPPGAPPRADHQYGNDNYDLQRDRLQAAGANHRLLLTMTLGDSARRGNVWYGRAIPADLFPYFAAPFIAQYREMSKDRRGYGVLDYRQGVLGLDDVLPKFHNGLEQRMTIPARQGGYSMMDEAVGADRFTVDYIEGQIWGEASFDLVSALNVERRSEPSPLLLDAYQRSGLRPSSYR